MPGSAKRMVEGYLRSEAVTADAIERLSAAEGFVAKCGIVGVQFVTLTALVLAAALLVTGRAGGALVAVLPAVLGAAAQVAAALRRPG